MSKKTSGPGNKICSSKEYFPPEAEVVLFLETSKKESDNLVNLLYGKALLCLGHRLGAPFDCFHICSVQF